MGKINPLNIIPKASSTDAEWVEFHKSLKDNLGKKHANTQFLRFWSKYGGAGTSASTTNLREYMKSQGVNLQTTAFEDLSDTSASIGDAFGGVFGAYKWFGLALGVIVVGGVGMIIYNIAKNPIEAGKTALALRTGGLK